MVNSNNNYEINALNVRIEASTASFKALICFAAKTNQQAIDAQAEALLARIQAVTSRREAEMAKMEAKTSKSEERKAWAAVENAKSEERKAWAAVENAKSEERKAWAAVEANESEKAKLAILAEEDTKVVIAECENSESYKNELQKARIELQLMYSYIDIFSTEMDNLVASLEDCLPGNLPLRNKL